MTHKDELVITGVGAATAAAYGIPAHWELLRAGEVRDGAELYSMQSFKAAPYLSDRRMLKAVSQADAIGLAALEGACKDADYKQGLYASERIGLYVGAPPASAFDNESYIDAMDASRDGSGRISARNFGKTSMQARPTTLLVGLPNNVLCYGAMILDARGPNSNYTASALAGQMAVINAARRMRRGALDLAVAGGFSAHCEAVNAGMLRSLGLARAAGPADAEGTVLADGGAFVTVERRVSAEERGAKILATYLGGAVTCDALGPTTIDESGAGLAACLEKALADSGVELSSIGLVLASATGLGRVDRCEFSVLSRVFAKARDYPALGNSTRVLGNLMEAAGVLELGLLPSLYAAGELPAAMVPGDGGPPFSRTIDQDKPHALILRTSPWGEYSVIVARRGTP